MIIMTESKPQVSGSQIKVSEFEQQKIRKKVIDQGFAGFEIYGIGGLGAKTAANMWAQSSSEENKKQINPKNRFQISVERNFGTERRGTGVLMKGTITNFENMDRLGYEPDEKDLFVFFSEETVKSDFEKYSKTGVNSPLSSLTLSPLVFIITIIFL